MNRETENRVAIVTGSGKGVGAGVVKAFCAAGIRSCVHYNSSEELAQKTLSEILDAGGEAFLYKADVTDEAQRRGLISAVYERYGRLDILVNNAAMQPNRYIDEYDADTLRMIWDINIGGYWHMAKDCLKYLKQSPEARIINVSSIHGKRPTSFDAGYAMTKGAIRMFTRELAAELMPYRIPVNAIDLGGCAIEYKTGNAPFRSHQPADSYNPDCLNRFSIVHPAEVGSLALFLISKDGGTLVGDGIRQDYGAALI